MVAYFYFREAIIDHFHYSKFCRRELMVKFRAANNFIELTFPSQRTVHLLKRKRIIGTNIRDGIKHGKITPNKPTDYPIEIIRPV